MVDAVEHVHSKSYSVPTGRPFNLKDLHSKLPSVSDQVRNLCPAGDPTEYDALADDLYEAFRVAAALAPPRTMTGCADHPQGPVDPLAPEGWSRCLYCNSFRRRGNPGTNVRAVQQGPGGYFVPGPPYNHQALLAMMQKVDALAFDLDYRTADAEFDAAVDAIHGAFVIARELSRPRNVAKCQRHPGAPVDVDVKEGPLCLFCRGEAARAKVKDVPMILPPVRRGERRSLRRRFPRPAFEQAQSDAQNAAHDASYDGQEAL